MGHISILYFPIGNGPIYHGKTTIKDIESMEKLTVHIKNPDTGITIYAADILPEYFFISIPLFNDRLEKEIDDWLYVMKHDDVPKVFHSPYMKKVSEKLSILKMTPEERLDRNWTRALSLNLCFQLFCVIITFSKAPVFIPDSRISRVRLATIAFRYAVFLASLQA